MRSRCAGSEILREPHGSVLEQLYGRLAQGEMIGSAKWSAPSAMRAHFEPPRWRGRREGRKVPAAQQIRTRKRLITARTPAQSAYLASLERNDLVFATGPAGTGKTYLAVAFAAACLESGRCDRLILSRPAVEAGERLGFLPGDMREKVDPYLRPLYDALYDVLAPERVERGLATGVIEIAPLAFMRGRTLSHAIDHSRRGAELHVDAAEDVSDQDRRESKMIVTGDPTQIDLPAGKIWACSRRWPFSRASRISTISPSPAATWFAANWSARSSTPMRRRPNGVSAMADGGPSRSSGGFPARNRNRVRHSDLWDSIEVSGDALARGAGCLRGVSASADAPCEVTLVLTDDDEMRELNRTWLGKDSSTNVLSFPAGEPVGETHGEPSLSATSCLPARR